MKSLSGKVIGDKLVALKKIFPISTEKLRFSVYEPELKARVTFEWEKSQKGLFRLKFRPQSTDPESDPWTEFWETPLGESLLLAYWS